MAHNGLVGFTAGSLAAQVLPFCLQFAAFYIIMNVQKSYLTA